MALKIATDDLYDCPLNREISRFINNLRGNVRVVAPEDDDSLMLARFDRDSFEGRWSVDKTCADPALNVLRLDVRPVVHQHDVARLERRFHTVVRQSQAIVLG